MHGQRIVDKRRDPRIAQGRTEAISVRRFDYELMEDRRTHRKRFRASRTFEDFANLLIAKHVTPSLDFFVEKNVRFRRHLRTVIHHIE